MSCMRILQTESSFGWGGQEIRILREAEGLRLRGFEIYFAVASGGLAKEAKGKGFVVYEIKYRKVFWFFSFFKLLFLLKRHRIDLVNTHSSEDSWLCGITARLIGIPVIRTRHLSTGVKGGLNSFFLYNLLADFIVTTCTSAIYEISKKSRKPVRFFKCVATGINPKEIVFEVEDSLAFRKKLGISKEILVGTACFMRSWKGIDDFLKAALILKEDKGIKWVIIGGGHIETYVARAKEMGLEDHVIFTGHLKNPFAVIDALDIFLLLSTAHEGIAQASLQAAFLQKPLITTDIGGLAEVCLHERTGLIVPPFSPEEVVKAVLRLKGDPLLRKKLGLAAKQHVEKKFTYEIMLNDMEQIFLEYGKK